MPTKEDLKSLQELPLEALKQDKILPWLKMPCKTDINDLWVRDKTNFLERISKFIVKNY